MASSSEPPVWLACCRTLVEMDAANVDFEAGSYSAVHARECVRASLVIISESRASGAVNRVAAAKEVLRLTTMAASSANSVLAAALDAVAEAANALEFARNAVAEAGAEVARAQIEEVDEDEASASASASTSTSTEAEAEITGVWI